MVEFVRNKHNTKAIISIPNKLFAKCKLSPLHEHNNLSNFADDFSNFFVDKVTTIWLKIIEKQEIKDRQHYISEKNPNSAMNTFKLVTKDDKKLLPFT